MANDNAVRNQKVFITLHAVVELTTEYRRVCEEHKAARQNGDHGLLMGQRKAALEYVIRTLDLPINI